MRVLVVNPAIGAIPMKYRKRNPTRILSKLGAFKLPPKVSQVIRNDVMPNYRKVWLGESKGAWKSRTPINVAGAAAAVPTTWIVQMGVADTLRKYGISEPDGWAIPVNALAQMGISYSIKNGVPYLVKAKNKSAFQRFGNAYRGAAYITLLGELAVLVINKTALKGSVMSPMGYNIDDFVADVKSGKLVNALKGTAGRAMGADLLEPLKLKVEELKSKLPQLKGLKGLRGWKFDMKGLSAEERRDFLTAFDGDMKTAVDGSEHHDDDMPKAFNTGEEGLEPSSTPYRDAGGVPSAYE